MGQHQAEPIWTAKDQKEGEEGPQEKKACLHLRKGS